MTRDEFPMSTRIAMEALSELSEKINNEELDLFPKTYYRTAISTVIKELVNYERLLEKMLSYQQQSYVNLEQQRAIQLLKEQQNKRGENMKDFNDLTLKEISEIVSKEKVRYELRIEPTGYGNSNTTITIEPWEQFDPKCPYGTPVVYVKDKKEAT